MNKQVKKKFKTVILILELIGAQLHAGIVMYAYKGVCARSEHNGQIDIAKLRNNTII